MEPTAFEDSQFALRHVLRRHNGHTVAAGLWQEEFPCLGLRWDGEEGHAGYPIGRRGRPKWYAVEDDLSVPFMEALLFAGLPGTDEAAIMAALNEVPRGTIGLRAGFPA